MEPLSRLNKTDKSADAQTDRIVLRKAEHEMLLSWVEQLNKEFEGMIRVTKADLANFVIRNHGPKLSPDEVRLIEHEHYDEVRWLSWALEKVRDAKRNGVSLSVAELMAKRKVASVDSGASLRSRRKTKKAAANETDENKSEALETAPGAEIVISDQVKKQHKTDLEYRS